MRNILLSILVAVLPASGAVAQQSSIARPDKSTASSKKLLPLKGAGASAGRSCAEYGPGFIQLAGSSTCVKIGGAVSIEAGGSRVGR